MISPHAKGTVVDNVNDVLKVPGPNLMLVGNSSRAAYWSNVATLVNCFNVNKHVIGSADERGDRESFRIVMMHANVRC